MTTVADRLTELFVVYGRAPEDRVTAYAQVLTDQAHCAACLNRALEDCRHAFDRMPTPKAILALYWGHHNEHRVDRRILDEPAPYTGPIDRASSPADDMAWGTLADPRPA